MTFQLLGLSLLLACASLPAHAVGRLADVTVIDRETGATLPLYRHQGDYWVAGTPGARYAISVRNQLGTRLLAVASVDGVNVISGETAAWDQRGYVFSPRERDQIVGWRKNSRDVAAFEFSDAQASYAGLTGRPDQVGVIGVALFRERLAEPEPRAQIESPAWSQRGDASNGARQDRRPAPSLAAPAPPPAGQNQGKSASRAGGDNSSAAEKKRAPAQDSASLGEIATPAPAAKLGTAHGQRETWVVGSTTFERRQSRPDEIIRIRYDSRANLLASGVIPAVRPSPVRPEPFPDSSPAAYVPDPPVRAYPLR